MKSVHKLAAGQWMERMTTTFKSRNAKPDKDGFTPGFRELVDGLYSAAKDAADVKLGKEEYNGYVFQDGSALVWKVSGESTVAAFEPPTELIEQLKRHLNAAEALHFWLVQHKGKSSRAVLKAMVT